MSKILVVDDIELNRYMLESLCRGQGYEVSVAANGEEALQIARADPPDLIISDILMPVMDGYSLCREWRNDERLRHIPFVFYTATYTDPKDRVFGLDLGADRYLIKPMDPPEAIRIIKEMLNTSPEQIKVDPQKAQLTETPYLKQYNEALIRKLETKMVQLEKTNQRLEGEMAERRQAEKQLRRLHTAIESAAETIIITDAQGAIEYVNPAFEKSTGHAKDEALGWDIRRLVLPGHGFDFYASILEKLNQALVWQGRLGAMTKDGQKIDFEGAISPIPDNEKDFSGLVAVFRDVTEQLKLEQQLAQAQKMEAIGTLAGGIAHDFNNILGAIIGHTDLALMGDCVAPRVRDHLNSALRACDRAKNLVEQILTFSRKTERERVILDICSLLKESQKFLRASLPSTVDIRSRMETPVVLVNGDPVQIQQVILNLCTNAAHSMRDTGGILEIALREVEFDEMEARQYPGVLPGKFQMLSISDTGCGMDRETISHIFEPFFTTKNRGEGTGLGLSVAHGIVKAHGGLITAYSEPGRGSTFNIYLPAAEGGSQASGAAPIGPLPSGDERVLFVDDEIDLVEIGREILEVLGYKVTAMQSSQEALEHFRRHPFDYDLVISDQTMPRLQGLELAEEMFKIREDIPFIVCTGFSVQISEENARARGIKGLIKKPFLVREVARAIRTVLD